MPIYEYECLECGRRFEMRQSIGDPPPGACPVGHPAVRRRLSAPAIVFKGSGFYITDHGRNGRSATVSGGKRRLESAQPESGGKKDTQAEGGGKTDKEPPNSE